MTEERMEIAGSSPQRSAALRPLRPADPNQMIEVTIVIRRPAVTVPTSGKTREEIEQALSAGAADLSAVTDFAKRYGLTVKEVSAPKRIVRVEGTIQNLSLAFGVHLAYFDGPNGSFLSYDGPLTVAPEVGAKIEAVLGLHQEPLAQPRS
jgi:hypothetical protein